METKNEMLKEFELSVDMPIESIPELQLILKYLKENKLPLLVVVNFANNILIRIGHTTHGIDSPITGDINIC